MKRHVHKTRQTKEKIDEVQWHDPSVHKEHQECSE